MRTALVARSDVMREGLARLLAIAGLDVAARYASTADAARHLGQLAADAAFITASALEASGLDAVDRIRAAAPRTAIILLNLGEQSEILLPALRHGVCCFLSQDYSPQSMLLAAQAAVQGYVLADRATLARALDGGGPRPRDARLANLTPREREALYLLSLGRSNREIGAALGISLGTARTHISNLLAKLEMTDRVQLAVWAAGQGFCHPRCDPRPPG